MRAKNIALIVVLLIGIYAMVFAKEKKRVIIKITASSIGDEFKTTLEQASLYMKDHPNVKIILYSLPSSTTDKLAYYLQLLEAKSGDIDICTIDIAWLGALAPSILDLRKYGAEKVTEKMFPRVAAAGVVNGKLVALPCWIDAGMLYSRMDLLKKYNLQVPKTWGDLTKYAQIVQQGERDAGNNKFVGFVWQGEAYDGLTCDALEWIYSNGGGTIVNNDKKVTLFNPEAIEAIEMAKNWIGTIAPINVTTMQEEESREVFQAGNAAFMRNWPYACVSAQSDKSKIKGKFNVGPLPAGKSGHSASTLGGWLLGVNKYSKHPEIAADIAKFFVSYAVQKDRALRTGRIPTLMSLYEDKDILKANPFYKEIFIILANAVLRPSRVTAPHYNKVSEVFYKAVYSVLTGTMSAKIALHDAAKKIASITGFSISNNNAMTKDK